MAMTLFVPGACFLLRTPALPFETIIEWCDGLTAAAVASIGGDLDTALALDEGRLRARLRTIVREPLVRRALAAASPSLDLALDPWLDDVDSERARTVEPAVVRYVMRMAGRATPFGLFAGGSVGTFGPKTGLYVPPPSEHARHTHVNFDWLSALAEGLSRRHAWRASLLYRPNTSLHEVAGKLRYHAVRLENALRSYRVRETPRTPHLDAALNLAAVQEGASLDAIARGLVSPSYATTVEAARAFVDAMVDQQLLRPTLLPTVTGRDPLTVLIEKLRAVPEAADVVDTLTAIARDLARLDTEDGVDTATLHASVLERARALAPEVDVDPLLLVDLRKPTDSVTLGHRVARETAAAVELLTSFAVDTETAMNRFARRFEERYRGREVPLLEALDPERGVGFDSPPPGSDVSPLLAELNADPNDDVRASWGGRDRFLLRKLAVALQTGATEILLSPADARELAVARPKAPPAGVDAMVSLAASSAEAADKGDFRLFVQSVCETTAGAWFGRFLHDEPRLLTGVQSTLRQEEAHDPDAIHAEIAYLPQALTRNTCTRPVLRDYEIDLLGSSGAPAGKRIAASDLLVSVADGRVTLRSKSLGARVLPHRSCSHAVNYGGLPLYRFLVLLQTEEYNRSIDWTWGAALESAPFLPRLTCGRVVLSLARWSLPGDRVRAITALEGAARFRAVQAMRDELRLPRFLRWAPNDNTLLVDLENALSIESWLRACQRVDTVLMTEVFPAADELVARGPQGAFHHELLVPLLRAPSINAVAVARPSTPRVVSAAELRRSPRSDWLFVKVYSGVSGVDRILTDVVAPLVSELRAAQSIDRWFFVRHADPEWHLRLRMHGEPSRLWAEVAPLLLERINEADGAVARVTVDTYEPEVERYGGSAAYALAEEVFEADSDAALALLAHHRNDAEARWQLALFGMSAMLADLGFGLDARRAIAAAARAAQSRKFPHERALLAHASTKYRALRPNVELLARLVLPAKYAAAAPAFMERSRVIANASNVLGDLERAGRVHESRANLATSYLHMWANRMLRGSANAQEVVLYDFLHRSYQSVLARERSNGAALATMQR